MARVIEFKPNDPNIPNRVVKYILSAHTPDYNVGNYLINPDLSRVEGIDKKYWRVVAGKVIEMSTDEKAIVNKEKTPKIERINVLANIMSSAEPTVQFPRMLEALDRYPTFAIVLDNHNYPLARMILQKALLAGMLIQDDYELAVSKMPS